VADQDSSEYWPKGRGGDDSQLEIGNWSSFDTTIVKLLLKVLLAPISFAAMLAAAGLRLVPPHDVHSHVRFWTAFGAGEVLRVPVAGLGSVGGVVHSVVR
jgi:hypothetical protein